MERAHAQAPIRFFSRARRSSYRRDLGPDLGGRWSGPCDNRHR